MEFYNWQEYRCAYETVPGKKLPEGEPSAVALPALLLIHPIGVGLSRHFWQPFIEAWQAAGSTRKIYNLDLLGCGDSDMPQRAYRPQDWAEQLAYFIEQVAREPVVLVVQGALLPVAVELMSLPAAEKVKGLVLSGPPAWPLMTTPSAAWKVKLAWSLFESPLGSAFYRYARREQFLKSFSKRQLFARAEDVTPEWLAMLHEGSRDMNSRYAVFSFLAGFWRQDWGDAIAKIRQPTLVVVGKGASTIDRRVSQEVDSNSLPDAEQRIRDYCDHFSNAEGVIVSGRNVLPYESVDEFVEAVKLLLAKLAVAV